MSVSSRSSFDPQRVWEDRAIEELATVAADRGVAQLLLAKIGFPMDRLPTFEQPDTFWHCVARELRAGAVLDGVARLIAAAKERYPHNEVFKPIYPAKAQPVSHRPPRTKKPLREIGSHIDRDEILVSELPHLAPLPEEMAKACWELVTSENGRPTVRHACLLLLHQHIAGNEPVAAYELLEDMRKNYVHEDKLEWKWYGRLRWRKWYIQDIGRLRTWSEVMESFQAMMEDPLGEGQVSGPPEEDVSSNLRAHWERLLHTMLSRYLRALESRGNTRMVEQAVSSLHSLIESSRRCLAHFVPESRMLHPDFVELARHAVDIARPDRRSLKALFHEVVRKWPPPTGADAQRLEVDLTEQESSLQRVKDFVKVLEEMEGVPLAGEIKNKLTTSVPIQKSEELAARLRRALGSWRVFCEIWLQNGSELRVPDAVRQLEEIAKVFDSLRPMVRPLADWRESWQRCRDELESGDPEPSQCIAALDQHISRSSTLLEAVVERRGTDDWGVEPQPLGNLERALVHHHTMLECRRDLVVGLEVLMLIDERRDSIDQTIQLLQKHTTEWSRPLCQSIGDFASLWNRLARAGGSGGVGALVSATAGELEAASEGVGRYRENLRTLAVSLSGRGTGEHELV
jgi:hypothetical protein